MDRSLVAGVLGNARCLPRAKDLRTCRRIPSLLCRAPSSTGGPRVRIHLPPAPSQERTGERTDAEHAARLYRSYALAMASCLWSVHWSGEFTAAKGSIEAARRYFHRV
jgi:hypothetical protein